MDKNFSDILGIFKRLDESRFHADGYTPVDDDEDDLEDIEPTIEGTMNDAEHHDSGPEFTGYWKGTDKATPGKKMVGGSCEESIEEEILREWQAFSEQQIDEKFKSKQELIDYFVKQGKSEAQGAAAWERGYRGQRPKVPKARAPSERQQRYWWHDKEDLAEYGMTTGGTANSTQPSNTVDQAKLNKEINNTTNNINKLKSAGVTLPTGTNQAAKSTVSTANDPKANPTGQNMDQNAKKTAMGLGQEMEKLLTTGNPTQVQQVATAMKQAKLGTR
jgi:hypothetical protein